MKKVCFLSGYFNNYSLKSKSQGGAEYQNFLLKQALENKNYSIYFISVGDRNEIKRDGTTIIIYLKKKKTRIFGDDFFLYSIAIFRILQRIKPEIIYQRGSSGWTGIGAFFAKKNKKKFIWAIASDEDVRPFKFEKFSSFIFNFIDFNFAYFGKKNNHAIIAQSENQKEIFLQNYNKNIDEVITNYHPIPTDKPNKPSELIEVLWVANFSPNKQPEVYLKLANEFQSVKNIKFTMIGRPYNGLDQLYLEKEIKKIKNLTYLGPLNQNQVNKLISESHILINTSQFEGFSNVYIQAWMRETVVLSLNSNPDNIFERYNCGYCAYGDIKKLINHLKLLISDPLKIKAMGKNGYNYAVQNHSIEHQIDKLIKYF